MTERLDFTALYRELDLAPGCSPAHLRAAYRRRVSRLHPDQGGNAEDTGRLQQLNRLYRAALDFERTHGRLPGDGGGRAAASRAEHGAAAPYGQTPYGDASPDRTAGPHSPAASGAAGEGAPDGLCDVSGDVSGDCHAHADTRDGMPRSLLLAVVAAVCVLAWRVLVEVPPPADPSAEREPAVVASAPAAARGGIERHGGLLIQGMSREMVLDIQGEPLDRNARRWLYGPSWVEFACDRVVGWYSSPLQPLRVRMERPTSSASADCAP